MHNCIVQIICQKFIINFNFPFLKGNNLPSSGSGFFFDKSHLILTCAHVIEHAVSISVHIPTYGKQLFDAEVVSVCPFYDIALLRIINAENLTLFHLSIDKNSMKHIKIKDDVEVKGYPLGQSNVKTTKGIISGQQYGFYQIDSPTNPGSSGGAVLKNGKIIGIANAGVPFANDVGYCIPIFRFLNIYKYMLKHKIVRIPEIWGFVYQSILDNKNNGVLINDLIPDTLATSFSSLPLEKGDILLQLGKYNVMNSCELDFKWLSENADFNDFLLMCSINSKIPFVIERNGKKLSGVFTMMQPEHKIRNLFFPQDTLHYCVFAGIVFLPLCINILKNINYYIRTNDNIFGEQEYDKSTMLNSTFAALINALSISNRNKPRIVIFNQLQGSKIFTLNIFRTGDLLQSCNQKPVNTITELHKILKSKSDHFLFKSDDGKSFSISAKDAQIENLNMHHKYNVPLQFTQQIYPSISQKISIP